jgi:hypothetical protein
MKPQAAAVRLPAYNDVVPPARLGDDGTRSMEI